MHYLKKLSVDIFSLIPNFCTDEENYNKEKEEYMKKKILKAQEKSHSQSRGVKLDLNKSSNKKQQKKKCY